MVNLSDPRVTEKRSRGLAEGRPLPAASSGPSRPNDPSARDGDRRPDSVDANVRCRFVGPGHEPLVELVGDRVEDRKHQPPGPRPAPRGRARQSRSARIPKTAMWSAFRTRKSRLAARRRHRPGSPRDGRRPARLRRAHSLPARSVATNESVRERTPDLRLANLQQRGEVIHEAATLEPISGLGLANVRPRRNRDPVGEIPVHEDGPEPRTSPSVRRAPSLGGSREADVEHAIAPWRYRCGDATAQYLSA
jgi:hypothetical protein